jgi:hypothetical protein
VARTGPVPPGGVLIQRVRPWRIEVNGVTDGNGLGRVHLHVEGLSGLELRAVLRLLADGATVALGPSVPPDADLPDGT